MTLKPDAILSFQFRSMVQEETDGKPILSALRKMLWDPNFKGFDMRVPDMEGRAPDGYFHPSTHPLAGEWWLYHYLVNPERMVPEVLEPTSTLAILIGHMMHGLSQHVLKLAGVIVDDEVYVEDPVTGARGSMDGLIDGYLDLLASFEFKSMNPTKLGKVQTLEDFIAKCPDYYAQAQEYQRMSGLRESRVIIMETSYPFSMVEIVVPYDPMFAAGIADKYLRVRAAAESQDIMALSPCCNGGAKAKHCEFTNVCPMAGGKAA